MKTLTVHPGSALAGASVLGLLLLGTGVAAPQGGTQRMFIENVHDINSYPNPRNALRINEGTPYTVPAEKLLVLTGSAQTGGEGGVTHLIRFDGAEVAKTYTLASTGWMTTFPDGFVAPAGTVVSTEYFSGGLPTTLGVLLGYLVDA